MSKFGNYFIACAQLLQQKVWPFFLTIVDLSTIGVLQ
jgi:hypothetical protein